MQYRQAVPISMVTQTQGAPAGLVTLTQGTFVNQNDRFNSIAAKQMLVLSAIQVAIGVLCVIFGSVLVVVAYSTSWPGAILGQVGYGVWIGLYYVVVGGIGMGAAMRNTARWIIASMVLHIICSVFWCVILAFFTTDALIGNALGTCSIYNLVYGHGSCNGQIRNTYLAMDSLMLIMGVTEFAITIWGAILCCGAVCRCCKAGRMFQYSSELAAENPQTLLEFTNPQAALPSQPPQPVYFRQQVPPSQPVEPPTYQAVAADQLPPAAYPSKYQ